MDVLHQWVKGHSLLITYLPSNDVIPLAGCKNVGRVWFMPADW